MSSVDTGPSGAWRRRGGCGRRGWAPLEILAVVLGFMVYWPIGLGLLGWKLVSRRGGFDPGPFADLRQKFDGFASWGANLDSGKTWRGFGAGQSGNAAFDEWRKQEIERLEAERQKLEAAQREFSDFVTEARKARDREEFERFMRDRPRGQA